MLFVNRLVTRQGAQVTHKAAARLSSSVRDRVVAAVTFGDPDQFDAYPGVINSRKLIFCNVGDLICLGQPVVLAPHLAYGAVRIYAALDLVQLI